MAFSRKADGSARSASRSSSGCREGRGFLSRRAGRRGNAAQLLVRGPTDPPGDEMLSAELKLAGAWLRSSARKNPRWRDAPRPGVAALADERRFDARSSCPSMSTMWMKAGPRLLLRCKPAFQERDASRDLLGRQDRWNLLEPFGHALAAPDASRRCGGCRPRRTIRGSAGSRPRRTGPRSEHDRRSGARVPHHSCA